MTFLQWRNHVYVYMNTTHNENNKWEMKFNYLKDNIKLVENCIVIFRMSGSSFLLVSVLLPYLAYITLYIWNLCIHLKF